MSFQFVDDSKLIQRHLGFLCTEYHLNYCMQEYEEYLGFSGPIYTHSFFCDSGCITLHHVVQRGEWGLFFANRFSNNQYELLKEEINQSDYIEKICWTTNQFLKQLGLSIRTQIKTFGTVFNKMHIK